MHLDSKANVGGLQAPTGLELQGGEGGEWKRIAMWKLNFHVVSEFRGLR